MRIVSVKTFNLNGHIGFLKICIILSIDASQIIHFLLCWAYNQFLTSHLDLNRLTSNTKYPAFHTGFHQSKRGRICISNHCICCYDNTAWICSESSMQSSKFESISIMWFRRFLREVSLIHTHCPPSHHAQRWKYFSATLMQGRKHEECTKASHKSIISEALPAGRLSVLLFLPHSS